MKNNRIALFFLIIILGVAAYLDSPYSFLNMNYSYTASEPASAQTINPIEQTDTPDTEEKLVRTEKSGGYIIETYREYEIYKDEEGNVTKRVPTSQYDELKYWDYKSKKK